MHTLVHSFGDRLALMLCSNRNKHQLSRWLGCLVAQKRLESSNCTDTCWPFVTRQGARCFSNRSLAQEARIETCSLFLKHQPTLAASYVQHCNWCTHNQHKLEMVWRKHPLQHLSST